MWHVMTYIMTYTMTYDLCVMSYDFLWFVWHVMECGLLWLMLWLMLWLTLWLMLWLVLLLVWHVMTNDSNVFSRRGVQCAVHLWSLPSAVLHVQISYTEQWSYEHLIKVNRKKNSIQESLCIPLLLWLTMCSIECPWCLPHVIHLAPSSDYRHWSGQITWL